MKLLRTWRAGVEDVRVRTGVILPGLPDEDTAGAKQNFYSNGESVL
jgi:hypothetical protein